MPTFAVHDHAEGERLDRFLTDALGTSRASVQKQIAAGYVQVDGRSRSAHYALRTGEVVEVSESPSIAPVPPTSPEPAVLTETDDVLVIDKPVGLVVHPAPGVQGLTLVDWLLRRTPSIAGVGEDPLRPGIVHRLDRLVSGVMVVAKTQAAFAHLKGEFQSHRVAKEYLALVDGVVQKPEGTLTFQLARSVRGHGKIAARPTGEEGREAVTHFVVERRGQQATLLRVRTETGRSHQVRAHLAAMGHAILGDPLYHSKSPKLKRPLGRLFLHATKLSFTDLSGVRQTFESPPPDAFQTEVRHLTDTPPA